jgi:hypothetical protein
MGQKRLLGYRQNKRLFLALFCKRHEHSRLQVEQIRSNRLFEGQENFTFAIDIVSRGDGVTPLVTAHRRPSRLLSNSPAAIKARVNLKPETTDPQA